jgi:D-serine deaminase-like pyridoxal phosphate-dependent protein
LPDQPFQWAGLVFTRVISKPKRGYLTVDLGHKAIASENPIDKRVKFLNLDHYRFISQSEEHLVLEVQDWEQWKVGDALYGVPYHICPTINLYEEACIIQQGQWVDTWKVVARKRKIAI